jgi:hypothetical protein
MNFSYDYLVAALRLQNFYPGFLPHELAFVAVLLVIRWRGKVSWMKSLAYTTLLSLLGWAVFAFWLHHDREAVGYGSLLLGVMVLMICHDQRQRTA